MPSRDRNTVTPLVETSSRRDKCSYKLCSKEVEILKETYSTKVDTPFLIGFNQQIYGLSYCMSIFLTLQKSKINKILPEFDFIKL